MRLEYVKNNITKYIREGSKLIPILKAEGWQLKKEKKAKAKKDGQE